MSQIEALRSLVRTYKDLMELNDIDYEFDDELAKVREMITWQIEDVKDCSFGSRSYTKTEEDEIEDPDVSTALSRFEQQIQAHKDIDTLSNNHTPGL